MRLSVSNIAWPVESDEAVAAALNAASVSFIDIAPGKYFSEPARATGQEIEKVRSVWAARGFNIAGMQALLFGTQGLNVFGGRESQSKLLDHLTAVCRIASCLGAAHLVFGSPKNRDRTGIELARALDVAVDVFAALGSRAGDHGLTVCLEPNPERYNCNFMTDSASTAAVVRAVGHPAIKMQFDTGAILENKENPAQVLAAHHDIIGHVHISEPGLITIGDGPYSHADVAKALNQYLPGKVCCIEMLTPPGSDASALISRAVKHVADVYKIISEQTGKVNDEH